MNWLEKIIPAKIKRETPNKSSSIPEGLWTKCSACAAVLYATDLRKQLEVCPKCNHHHPIGARKRIDIMLDEEGREEIAQKVRPVDPLKFKDIRKYTERLQQAKKQTQEEDALVVTQGYMHGLPVVVAAFEFQFIGGSMGSVVGERFVQGIRQAVASRSAFVCVTTSGGARMQEGLHSLMQMAKTTAALDLLHQARLPFISVLADPTMGGVSASFAFLGDIVVAEPKTRIGFAGRRVIEQTVRENLPEGFQSSEFLLEKGAIDQIIDRRSMKNHLSKLIAMLCHDPSPLIQSL